MVAAHQSGNRSHDNQKEQEEYELNRQYFIVMARDRFARNWSSGGKLVCLRHRFFGSRICAAS